MAPRAIADTLKRSASGGRLLSQLLAVWENWILLIAALWLASILLFVFSLRRYFAGRAFEREDALTPIQEPFIEVTRTPQRLGAEDDTVTGVESAARQVADQHTGTTSASADNRDQALSERRTQAANADGVAPPIPLEPAIGAEGVFAAVGARIARDPASAQGLSELIRALYLDESHFTFHALAELDAEDRALAQALIEEWLADPSAVEAWEEIYDTVRSSHSVSPRRKVGVAATSMSLGAAP